MGRVIDPAEQATWPADVLAEVERLAAQCRNQPANTVDTPSCELRLGHVDAGDEAEQAFRSLLDPHLVVLFHATGCCRTNIGRSGKRG